MGPGGDVKERQAAFDTGRISKPGGERRHRLHLTAAKSWRGQPIMVLVDANLATAVPVDAKRLGCGQVS